MSARRPRVNEKVVEAVRQRAPGLSETLTAPKRPDTCQSCGVAPGDLAQLLRWRECDPEDHPTGTRLFLCRPCSARLIVPHARLYLSEHYWLPIPGAMPCCTGCAYREALTCMHTAQKRRGGPGLRVNWTPGPQGIMCGIGGCRDMATAMPQRAPTCEGYEAKL